MHSESWFEVNYRKHGSHYFQCIANTSYNYENKKCRDILSSIYSYFVCVNAHLVKMCVCGTVFGIGLIDQLFVWDPVCHSFSGVACEHFMMQTTVQPPGKYIIN